mmetsp:Transcript_15585/g.38333  ORF Transcript_15585/g.38333 Transcript_15585/m.38333 type:complete len:207 (+) Transcript_15585:758-1378(+)
MHYIVDLLAHQDTEPPAEGRVGLGLQLNLSVCALAQRGQMLALLPHQRPAGLRGHHHGNRRLVHPAEPQDHPADQVSRRGYGLQGALQAALALAQQGLALAFLLIETGLGASHRLDVVDGLASLADHKPHVGAPNQDVDRHLLVLFVLLQPQPLVLGQQVRDSLLHVCGGGGDGVGGVHVFAAEAGERGSSQEEGSQRLTLEPRLG